MDNGIIIKENTNTEIQEIQRITVSKEAQAALANILNRVNEGFEGGRVNKTQMANWILLHFNERISEDIIKEIQAQHFDEVAMLETILKKAKELGKVPNEFKALLQKQLGINENIKKKRIEP